MTVTISLSPDEEQKLSGRAAQSGRDIASYIRKLIEQDLGTAPKVNEAASVEEKQDTLLGEVVLKHDDAQPLQKKTLTEDEFMQHLLEIGLVSQLPIAPDQDADEEEDAPITITGEPLSVTVVREHGSVAAFFLDTSALVKRHIQEAGTAWVGNLTRAGEPHKLYLARITAVEIFAAITRRERGGSFTPAQGAAILGHFRRHLNQRYIVVELSPTLLEDAMRLARRHGLRGYDAVQLAAARLLNQQRVTAGLSTVTLVSADAELNAAALAEGFLVENPNVYP